MALTGRFSLRKSFSGRIILQVEEEVKSAWGLFSSKPKFRRRWRDAKAMDLSATELRALMDLRNRPRSFSQAFEPTQIVRPASRPADGAVPTLNSSGLREEGQAVTAH
jgi:methionine aminopeptidase